MHRQTIICISILCLSLPAFGQKDVLQEINEHAQKISGNVGVYALLLETGDTVAYHAEEQYPMQSVYKFPIAMAVLSQVDQGKLSLDQVIQVQATDYIPEQGYSPIRDKYPEGVALSLRELLRYAILSDGSASDVLLKTIGGIEVAHAYVQRLGVSAMAIALTEKIQVANDTMQYQNWSTPRAMTQLLKIFYTDDVLSAPSRELLLHDMINSKTGLHRLKGMLPEGTVVAHKTGTAGTYNGLTRATNDAGIITLPNGKHMAVSVFISDSYASSEERDLVIASITKSIFDRWKD
ncbi:class A beta-lactamase [Catalinimonas sp. 4WD22]|uniref:class A beta-lactamase n=1 Tax=Catalinimonas locisalis TaxID=3133978 RepID=UPI003100E1A4